MDAKEQSSHDTQVLVRAAQKLLAKATLEERLGCIRESLRECLGWDRGWLGLVDREAGVLRTRDCYGEDVPPGVILDEIPLDETIKNPALAPLFEKKPVLVTDPLHDPRCQDFKEGIIALETKCFATVPILIRDEVIGAIGVDRVGERASFTSEDIELLVGFASLAGLALENARLYDRAKELSLTDEVTELHNIRFFRDQLTRELVRARRRREPVSLFFIDVDQLKEVNDRFGHRAGDRLLKELGHTMRSAVRASDIVARYGGDEFVVLSPSVDGRTAYEIARRIVDLIAKLSPVGGEIQPTVSVGIASYPEDATDEEQLFQVADAAMFRAKKAGGNTISMGKGESAS